MKSSGDLGDRQAGRVRQLLRSYSAGVGSQRLVVRGVSPVVVQPLRVETVDFVSDQERAARLITFLPMLLFMTVFVGSLQIATDSTAGERERGSLEPLLANPVHRSSMVIGKWVVAVKFSSTCAVLTTIAVLLVIEYSPARELGVNITLGWKQIAVLLVAILPLAMWVAALQMAVSTLARSYKEAQSYVSFLMILPMVPAFLSIRLDAEQQAWEQFAPVFAQHHLILAAVEGNPVDPLRLGLAGAMTLGLAGLFLFWTVALFKRERIIFGR